MAFPKNGPPFPPGFVMINLPLWAGDRTDSTCEELSKGISGHMRAPCASAEDLTLREDDDDQDGEEDVVHW